MKEPASESTELPFALVRAALLSVDEAARMVAAGDCDDPVARAAVELAAGPRVADGDNERARTARVRYLARMGGRATPFGLFAGTAVAGVGEQRQLEVGPQAEHHALVRVDVEALRLLVQESFDEQPLERRPLRTNPTLRVDGSVLRFARSGDATADVVAMRAKPAILAVLARLEERGSATGAELVDALVEHTPQVEPAALTAFAQKLVEAGLLVPAVDLVEPGVEPVDHALALLDRMGDTGRAAALRELVATGCGARPLDATLPGRLGSAWERAAGSVWSDVEAAHRYHLELQLGMRAATVDRATIDDIEAALLRLRALASGRHELDDVRDAFVARYEDAEVPLLEALDLECGVVVHHQRGTSVLAGTAGVRFADGDDPPRVDPRRLEILDRWLRAGAPADGVDIADLPMAEHSPVRSAQAVLLDDHNGRYRSMLVGGGGRAPFALIARFVLGRDDLTARMRDWVQDEPGERPVRAELVYNPGGRIANVLIRPRVYDDTIALTGAAGGTLALDRLLLRVQGDRFVLRDAHSGRPVQVELSSAHNVDMAGMDPLYSFLGHLAAPGGAAWSWGALDRMSHLPRITCGSVVVTPERWRIENDVLRAVLASPDPAERLRAMLPGVGDRRWVGTGVHDHILPIDLTTSASVTAAFGKIGQGTSKQRSGTFDIVEMPQLESPAVAGPTGRHVAEIIVPVRARQPMAVGAVPARFDGDRTDGWVYFRFHTGFAAADAVVARVAELAGRLRAGGTATGWFFLRYGADGHHVRVRVRPACGPGNTDAVVAALGRLGRELRTEGLASRVVMDGYVPEVARYGGAAGLALAEELFVADSDDVARVIAAGADESTRLYRTVGDMVAWCDALFPDPADAQEFLRKGSAGQGLEFRADGNRHGQFHREHRAALERHLTGAIPDPVVLERLGALAVSVRERLDRHRCDSVLGSALHLHCNRMFAFDANRLEFLAYELARRTLRGRAARRRAS